MFFFLSIVRSFWLQSALKDQKLAIYTLEYLERNVFANVFTLNREYKNVYDRVKRMLFSEH